jgi:hypothetical protein
MRTSGINAPAIMSCTRGAHQLSNTLLMPLPEIQFFLGRAKSSACCGG